MTRSSVKYLAFFAASVMGAFLLNAECSYAGGKFSVGHTGGNLVSALYRASEQPGWDDKFEAVKLGSSSDVGYALISGSLDAGFVDVTRVKYFANLPGFEKLAGAGRITFPYGATLVLRKGLNLRIGELEWRKIAASSPECVLLEAFREDASRLKADISGVEFVYMPFDAMLPALEAREVDGAVLKGASAAVAVSQGHSILYQNWDVQPGDECCPAIIDQAVQVLLVRRDAKETGDALVKSILEAQSGGSDILRKSAAEHTTIPMSVLESQPIPQFDTADDSLVALLGEFFDEEGNKLDPDEDED
jgi:ABC-type nitrate/sulfonate/bicarbonate transport system substrate-binding protein